MTLARSTALAFALLLVAGCSGGSPGTSAPPFPPPKQPQSGGLYPQDSTAARAILANVAPAGARAPQGWSGDGDNDTDDGDWGTLVLPSMVSCGDGTYATDCSVWRWGSPNGTRSVARGGLAFTPGSNGMAPALNFCRDSSLYPTDLAAPAIPLYGLAPYSFTLTYLGTKPTPIVAFATRWWNVSFDGGFQSGGKTGNATLTPVLTTAASRGWLLFFTWSWPADVVAVPYGINEIQLASTSAPLTVPPRGSAQLGAFDCLGRTIAAHRTGGGIGFGPSEGSPTVASTGPELNVPVYGFANPTGSIVLRDDRGARTVTTVVP
ncbi:MAG TPA: hypothetical protein VHS78_14540 [Candidatus Elarobacter sp.]|jgi:hypothetical protein|nr:hypothetical protein [Candidatus Elarobacter sp.]